jgi:methyl-accepting chemotaxis protein
MAQTSKKSRTHVAAGAAARNGAGAKQQMEEMRRQLDGISRSLSVIEFDMDGNVLDANQNFLGALGYGRDEVVGQHHRMFLDPAYASSADYREFWTGLRRGETQTAEFRRQGKGGRSVFIQASYIPIVDGKGKPYKVIKYATDLTAEKLRAERLVKEERERILRETARTRSALDASTTLVMMADEKLAIIYVNDAMKAFLNRFEDELRKDLPRFDPERLMGSALDSFHKRPEQQRRLLEGLKEPHKERMQLGGRVMDVAIIVARDAEGKTIGYATEWIDQTEQVLAQSEVEQLLKSAVDGDLTRRLDASRYDGFVRQIAEGMNRLLDSISASFRQVKTAVEQIGEAATQLRTTSQMMSSGAVELNRAADDSSSSLTKAAEMVRANAENAALANQLVTQTSSAAQDGQQRMQDMNSAMGTINSSAQQIAKIIKVIDEIAFQTNLLALNAAVEAARAGRHGKGFAVVAQEVRNLAERSAKAAKETAQLIEDSVEKVAQGVKIAESTRGALEAIIGNVAKVVDLAGEIATASDEQSRTLAAVTKSMTQVTENAQAGSQQSNEVASAAEEMGRQMDVLKERVDAYKVVGANKELGLPPGVSAELVEHVAQLLLSRGLITSRRVSANDQSENGRAARGANHAAVPAAPADPRLVLPLDADERGFGGF